MIDLFILHKYILKPIIGVFLCNFYTFKNSLICFCVASASRARIIVSIVDTLAFFLTSKAMYLVFSIMGGTHVFNCMLNIHDESSRDGWWWCLCNAMNVLNCTLKMVRFISVCLSTYLYFTTTEKELRKNNFWWRLNFTKCLFGIYVNSNLHFSLFLLARGNIACGKVPRLWAPCLCSHSSSGTL